METVDTKCSLDSRKESREELKTVGVVLSNRQNYKIPAYQRGYRWDEEQIKDLIEDLYRFYESLIEKGKGEIDKKNEDYYCLQSLVLIKDEDDNKDKDKYIVIDGQQRLTTMYIIVSLLMSIKNDSFDVLKDGLCNIEYESRNDTAVFLKSISEQKEKINTEDENKIKNRDIYYIAMAYNKILELKDCYNDFEWLKKLIEGNRIKFIVQAYENNTIDEVDVFESINTGKIPLTDAELIRAKILLQVKDANDKDGIAKKWDEIEHTLQKNSFWYFIQDKNDTSASRINYLFTVLANVIASEQVKGSGEKNSDLKEKINKINERTINGTHELYRFLGEYRFGNGENENDYTPGKGDTFENEISVKVFWEKVKELYEVLNKWYGDIELYNYVGQILYIELDKDGQEKNGANSSQALCVELFDEYNKKSRYEFIEYLKKRMLKGFGDTTYVWPKPVTEKDLTKEDLEEYNNNGKLDKNKFYWRDKACSDLKEILSQGGVFDRGKIFGGLWYSGRHEKTNNKDDSKSKDSKSKISPDRDAVIRFLLWSNCEYLNEHLKNMKYEALFLNEKSNSKHINMRDSIPFGEEQNVEMYRFPFDIFKTYKFDIEHVDSYIDASEKDAFWTDDKNKKKRNSWCRNTIEVLSPDEVGNLKNWINGEKFNVEEQAAKKVDQIKKDINEKIEKVRNINNGENIEDDNWMLFDDFDFDTGNLYMQFSSYVKNDIMNELDDSLSLATEDLDEKWRDDVKPDKRKIGNLTLLDSNINRGYGNSVYRVKRRDIIEKSFAGKYVYPCTKLVFLKEFNPLAADLTRWTEGDFIEYKNFLIDLFYDCFFINQKETDRIIKECIKESVADNKNTYIKKKFYYNKLMQQ